MNAGPEQIASDWIVYARYGANEAPEEIFDRGWVIYDLAPEQPTLAWEVIKAVVRRYSEDELFTVSETEAKRIVGNTAAGPLEDLLSEHGVDFIETIETEARRDCRMRWTLGCVWQNAMPDDIWSRVQRAAGDISR
jgi:hypothetical protein